VLNIVDAQTLCGCAALTYVCSLVSLDCTEHLLIRLLGGLFARVCLSAVLLYRLLMCESVHRRRIFLALVVVVFKL